MQSILERFEQAKSKGIETLGKTTGAQDEQGDKEEVPGAVASVTAAAGGATTGVGSAHSMDVASVAAAAGVATAGVGSAHSMDGERCDTELAPSMTQPAAGAEGVEMFTTPRQQLPVDDAHLPVSRQENKDSLKDFGELLMDQMSSILNKHAQGWEDRMSSILDKHAQGREDRMSSILDKHLTHLALQPAEQKKRTAEEVAVKVSATTAAASAQAPATVALSTAVALAPKDICKYPEQVHQDEVVKTAYAASAGTQEVACTVAAVGEPPTAFAPATAPGEMMDSDVDPWITQFLTQLDAKGEAQREQSVQLERMKEQKVVQSTRDHKLQHEQIQQQSVGVTKLGRLAESSGQEALQQAVQHTTGEGELSTGLIFKCGDVEEKPH